MQVAFSFLFSIIFLRRVPVCFMTGVKGYEFSSFYIFFYIAVIKSYDKLLLPVMDCFSSFNKTFLGLGINVKFFNYLNKCKMTLLCWLRRSLLQNFAH